MFKNVLISLIFTVFSIASVSVFAVSNEAVSVLSTINTANNDTVLLQAVNKRSDIAKNVTSQSKFHAVEKSESAFSTSWLVIVALFWFVIMSNRRGVCFIVSKTQFIL